MACTTATGIASPRFVAPCVALTRHFSRRTSHRHVLRRLGLRSCEVARLASSCRACPVRAAAPGFLESARVAMWCPVLDHPASRRLASGRVISDVAVTRVKATEDSPWQDIIHIVEDADRTWFIVTDLESLVDVIDELPISQ